MVLGGIAAHLFVFGGGFGRAEAIDMGFESGGKGHDSTQRAKEVRSVIQPLILIVLGWFVDRAHDSQEIVGLSNTVVEELISWSGVELQEMGVAMISYPRLMSTGAVRGMVNAMDALIDMIDGGETVERPDLLYPFKDLNALVGINYLDELEQRYAGPDE